MNTLCQASAADLMKVAMINVVHALQSFSSSQRATAVRPSCQPNDDQFRESKVRTCVSIPARIVLQIHDELLLEVDEKNLADVMPVVRDAMVNSAHGVINTQHEIQNDLLQPNEGEDINCNFPIKQSKRDAKADKQIFNDLRVPLEVTMEIGKRWGSMHKVPAASHTWKSDLS